jgi:hypothetical protein
LLPGAAGLAVTLPGMMILGTFNDPGVLLLGVVGEIFPRPLLRLDTNRFLFFDGFVVILRPS